MSDILDLHEKVVKRFTDDLTRIPAIQNTLHELQQIDTGKLNPKAVHAVRENITTLQSELEAIRYALNYNFYLLDVTPLLVEYKNILSKPVRISFTGAPVQTNTDDKDRLAEQIRNVIMKHTPMTFDMKVKPNNVSTCRNCDASLKSHIAYQSKLICLECGNEETCNQYVSGYKDNERVSVVSKYSYNRRIHFKDCMYQFQGKQKSVIPDSVINMITNQCIQLGLVHENRALSKPQRFSRVTWRHIFMLLKDNSLSKYYEDVYLIYHRVTGKKLHDISHLEDRLLNDFDILSDLYNTMYINDQNFSRKNFISMQYVLFQLLRRYNYPCRKSDFNFIKTTERQCFHDYICSNLFRKLGWNHTSIF